MLRTEPPQAHYQLPLGELSSRPFLRGWDKCPEDFKATPQNARLTGIVILVKGSEVSEATSTILVNDRWLWAVT